MISHSSTSSIAGFLTRKPGVCLTVSAPGFLNGLTALAHATTNCFPMILISGSSEREIVDLQQGDYEEMDQLAIAKPLCKAAFRVLHAQDIGVGIARASGVRLGGAVALVHFKHRQFETSLQLPRKTPGAQRVLVFGAIGLVLNSLLFRWESTDPLPFGRLAGGLGLLALALGAAAASQAATIPTMITQQAAPITSSMVGMRRFLTTNGVPKAASQVRAANGRA